MKLRKVRQEFRKIRIRRKIYGTDERPRLSVFRSLKYIYAQIINDLEGKTVVAASSRQKDFPKSTGLKAAEHVGAQLAGLAMKKGVKKVVFDRGGKPYMGQIKALAEAARQKGLEF